MTSVPSGTPAQPDSGGAPVSRSDRRIGLSVRPAFVGGSDVGGKSDASSMSISSLSRLFGKCSNATELLLAIAGADASGIDFYCSESLFLRSRSSGPSSSIRCPPSLDWGLEIVSHSRETSRAVVGGSQFVLCSVIKKAPSTKAKSTSKSVTTKTTPTSAASAAAAEDDDDGLFIEADDAKEEENDVEKEEEADAAMFDETDDEDENDLCLSDTPSPKKKKPAKRQKNCCSNPGCAGGSKPVRCASDGCDWTGCKDCCDDDAYGMKLDNGGWVCDNHIRY
mmetsp:Transcript_3913/g.9170  ORF Transcript_3913/g.9170 Transcript_3913/m.9170 type:complete len:280 (+) Transcript_3913:169-1008(+)|eukprot:CAMPEP_0185813536 /NCGR_PEP_ID=MMETSP1322-20130828/11755_1 /TAXON_ID=265543 /ORGANISM="Minutocellus polymorphus, Strain RCC2270" /LENGTH=279 /DNA_ID=CAMNT_0028510209 /DNA_START=92 /DNA_END=931 /DNA_ORIENTATION=-